ncbi:MAG TPA: iron-sulfur cluster assembly accessory protein [Thiotrichales bacterium]|nr:iron-sulfur cluster assembly accessory protein [Thiotrichales bacterium]
MITLTPAAAEQIRHSAKQSQAEGLPLRIAAQRTPEGGIHYGMGFDDAEREGDSRFTSEGVELVVAATSLPLVEGMTIDFVELEPGRLEFIFLNPQDPNYKPAENEG